MSDDLVVDQHYSYATHDDVQTPDWATLTRWGQFRRCTVADLVRWCEQHGQNLAAVEVGGGHVSYRETETAAERQKRLDGVARSVARHEAWERETYERLQAKFSGAQRSEEPL